MSKKMPTLLSEYNPDWPIGGLDEVVVAVRKCIAKERLDLTVRPKLGDKYTERLVPLTVPASLQEQILLAIMRRRDITLHEVGDLPILEVSSANLCEQPSATSTKSFGEWSLGFTRFRQFSAVRSRITRLHQFLIHLPLSVGRRSG